MAGVLVGRNEDEVRERQAALMAAFGEQGTEEGAAWLEERRTRWIFGTPDEARAAVRRFADVGVERIMLQDFLPWDLDMVDVMGESRRAGLESGPTGRDRRRCSWSNKPSSLGRTTAVSRRIWCRDIETPESP